MRAIATVLIALSVASPALAQTATPPARFGPAPWWMDQPIIASTGMVEMKLTANRARFGASFQSVARTAPEATKDAADKVRAVSKVLADFGAERVRIETTFSMRPLYDQYRNKEGSLVANDRADKIESYEVNAHVSVDVRDVSLIERAYATVIAARPTSIQNVYFSLEADNATKTELHGLAVADAARRAKLAVDATGARLGPVKLIDPTGRACETDVLVTGSPRIPRDYGEASQQSAMDRKKAGVTVTPDFSNVDILPLQPPQMSLTDKACVVYSLGG